MYQLYFWLGLQEPSLSQLLELLDLDTTGMQIYWRNLAQSSTVIKPFQIIPELKQCKSYSSTAGQNFKQRTLSLYKVNINLKLII